MSTSTTFQKINDLFQCKLTLSDGKEFTIPLREDGYIHATKLCQAAGKQLSKWKNSPETKKIVDRKIEICSLGITQLIQVFKGKTNRYEQGTWVHPDLGLHLAQWCSPVFSLQVSKWMKELIFTGKVEIGNEKSNEEIINQLQEKLKEAEDVIISYDNENKHLLCKYNKLYQTHQAYLKRKDLYKLKEGSCVYLVNMLTTDDSKDTLKIKVGHTGTITDRVSTFRTTNPFCKLLFVLYTNQNILVESMMKIRYEKELKQNNSEFITGVPLDNIINDLKNFADSLNIPYSVEIEEELDKFNRHIIPIEDIEKIEEELNDEITIDSEKFKRCGGTTHKTEESRILPLDQFFKNSGNKDGVARICKECFLVGRYGDERKKRKVVVIPKYDILTHKWCNRCESVKERNMFYKDSSTKDGIGSNCKACKSDQKKKLKKEKEETDQEVN
jgi:hypothetical protein